jgi:chromosome segregation ATPase
LEFLPPTEVIEEDSRDNIKHILQLQEELDRARTRIEGQTKHIEDLQSELLAKEELIRSLKEKQYCEYYELHGKNNELPRYA